VHVLLISPNKNPAATNRTVGKTRFQKAYGTRLSKENGSVVSLEVDATFRLSSCSKLMTTVAALQCVERGLVTLDEDVTRILPELKDIEILTSFDRKTQKPIFFRRRTQITLRSVNPFYTMLFFFKSQQSTYKISHLIFP
jgi:CubicO group peptidase (beta-lactamase class C family)